MGDSVERRRLDEEWEKKSLVEKWSDTYHGRRQSKRTAQRSYYACSFLGWYGILTELYTTLKYLIPFDYAGYSDCTIYLRNILACFIFVNCIANWMCLQFYNTFHEQTADRPKREEKPNMIYATIQDKLNCLQYQNGHKSHMNGFGNSKTKNGYGKSKSTLEIGVGGQSDEMSKPHPSIDWRYCDICEMPQPPRCHHCNLCEKCVLKRDHHCYIAGRCVGYYNQRYFVMLVFFASVVCIQTLTSTHRYLQVHFTAKNYWDYFLPITFVNWWNGEIQRHIFIMISHFYVFSWSGFMCIGFFIGQIYFIFLGKTMFEAQKMDDLVCTAPVSKKFRSVFGHFWLLNFIFPAQLVYKQESDGMTWNDLKLVPKNKKPGKHVKSYRDRV